MTVTPPDGASGPMVILGDVLLAADRHGIERAEAILVADGRVRAAGRREEVVDVAPRGARTLDVGRQAVIPGLQDFHLHLVGLARMRVDLDLGAAAEYGSLLERVTERAGALPPGAWLVGRGWRETSLDQGALDRLEAAVGARPAFLGSHDGHSAWASAAALRAAGVGHVTADPRGGRLERTPSGEPNGVLREAARDLVEPHVQRARGDELAQALAATIRDLHALGVTGATDAGDYTTLAGEGRWADLGDSASALAGLAATIDGGLRLTVDVPADALRSGAAARHAVVTGTAVDGAATVRWGWAKVYADGALGSRTAALFEPYTCPEAGDSSGILRVAREELAELFGMGRSGGIGLAVHAIGDRAVSTVLDAAAAAPPKAPTAPPDRMEHVQLARAADRGRFAQLNLTASVQPIHATGDRDAVDACWGGREQDAYAFGSLARAEALLAFGSDAPVEDVNPWLGMFAAVHRRMPGDGRPSWQPQERLTPSDALCAYTLGPAQGLARDDEGHLRPGAVADLAVLSTDLETLLSADDRLAEVRAHMVLVAGVERYRS